MTKSEAIELLKSGRIDEWNDYRRHHSDWRPDLSNTDLSACKLRSGDYKAFNLHCADLRGATLPDIDDHTSEFGFDKLYQAFFKDCLVDVFTKHPNGYRPVSLGAMYVSSSQTDPSQAGGPSTTAFISYAWANEELVLAIDKWLRLKGIMTRVDKRDFFAGSRIRDEILRVMSQGDSVVVFHSSQSKDKPWVQFERELASDLEMEAKNTGRAPPRIVYFVVDDSSLPSVIERNRIAVLAKGKTFTDACHELYRALRQSAGDPRDVDLEKWSKHVF